MVRNQSIPSNQVLEERCLSGHGDWIINIVGIEMGDQTALGIGWTESWATDSITFPTVFSRESAALLLQVIYTTFTAIDDPDAYFRLIDPAALIPKSRRPDHAIIGSVRETGALQILARWNTSPYAAEVTIYPQNARRGPTAIFEKGSIARIGLAIEKIFDEHQWPKPE